MCALLVGFLSIELQAWMGETTLISQPPIAHRKGDKKVALLVIKRLIMTHSDWEPSMLVSAASVASS